MSNGTQIRRDVWNPYREGGFVGPVNPDNPNPSAHGNIQRDEVRHKDGVWERRSVLRNFGAVEVGPAIEISDEEGEAAFEQAKRF